MASMAAASAGCTSMVTAMVQLSPGSRRPDLGKVEGVVSTGGAGRGVGVARCMVGVVDSAVGRQ